MTDLAVQNIANFWLKIQNINHWYNFDFTSEILKEPPFYALVSMYKNTSLCIKNTRAVQPYWVLFLRAIKEARK